MVRGRDDDGSVAYERRSSAVRPKSMIAILPDTGGGILGGRYRIYGQLDWWRSTSEDSQPSKRHLFSLFVNSAAACWDVRPAYVTR
jgi:hypothetical protein